MDIDSSISDWIIEFLLRQPLENHAINSLINTLPLPDNNRNLKKALLLKKLELETSQDSLLESTLELFEQLEELDFQDGVESKDSLRRAYCAVAVQCTAKWLVNGGEGSSRFEFFEAVKRVWRGRVARIGREGGLGSEELWWWKDQLEAAVWEESVSDGVMKRVREVNSVEAVNVYVKEERARMGPSFLEVVAERLEKDEVLKGVLGLVNSANVVKEVPASRPADQDLGFTNGSREVQKDTAPRRLKHVAIKNSIQSLAGSSRGVRIADPDDMTAGPLLNKSDLLSTPEVTRVQEALRKSSLDLQGVVKDPLPDALRLAEAISGMGRATVHHEPLPQNHVGGNASVNNGPAVQPNGGHASCATRPSLMERNNTARTFEWDESIDGSPEDSAVGMSRLQLPTPRRRLVSPLRKYEMKKFTKRRQFKRWSTLEEDTLRTGVQKYGMGNWKVILTSYRDIFEDRTEVDLKDKWRNMTRY